MAMASYISSGSSARRPARVVGALLLLVICSSCAGPDGGHRHNLWTRYRAHGLLAWPRPISGDEVRQIARIEGELYLATDGGVSRKRPDRFINYRALDGLGGDDVRWVFPLGGEVAAAGGWGLGAFNGRSWRSIALPVAGTVRLAVGHRGEAVLVVGGKIIAYDGLGFRSIDLPAAWGEPLGLWSAGGRLFAALPGGLAVWAGQSPRTGARRLPYPAGVSAADVRGLVGGRVVWLAGRRGLFSLAANETNWRHRPPAVLGLSTNEVEAMALNGDDLWLAGGGEIALLSEYDLLHARWRSSSWGRKSGLPAAEITTICASDDEVWVGSRGRGVARMDLQGKREK